MQAVTVSFVQTERDVVESMRHVLRHGYLRWLTLSLSLVVALAIAVPFWIVLGDLPGLLLIVVPAGIALLQFAVNWYVLPPFVAYKSIGFWDYDDQLLGSTTVRVAPAGITWSGPTATWSVPWGIVRGVETVPSGICVTAGRPRATLWIPARSFPAAEDLEMTGRLAAQYASAATPVPVEEIEWPQNRHQRKSGLIFGIVYGGQMLLVMLLYLLLK